MSVQLQVHFSGIPRHIASFVNGGLKEHAVQQQETKDTVVTSSPFSLSSSPCSPSASAQHSGDNVEQIAIAARLSGELVGALTGKFFFGCLRISNLYVHPSFRQRRIGSALIQRACDIAVSSGQCTFATVETFEFQAREFYQRLGFVVEFSRSGYRLKGGGACSEQTLHFLRKSIV